MTASVKLISIASVTTGAVGTAGVIYFKPKQANVTIRQELEKLGKTILRKAEDSRWEIQEYIYKEVISKTPSFKIDDKGVLTKNELSQWCLESLNKPYSLDLYNKVKAFCLAPSAKDKLSKNNKTVATSLTQQVENYKKYTQNDDLKIPEQEMENKKQDTLTEGDLKKWCNSHLGMELYDGDDKNYKRVEKWCTNTV
ncbi:hypothetical protein MHC_00755 [Mycoplasma haemocanis str. Illinois]|uniref:Uncharacterized protein n=1 Tax=Mycoplasma haemocanis (strain Illinois) TaxID=1111676 RepID=H6N5Q7_MYCHN|nr:hypothetical protein [Mycoplasma haemocanis]AEW45017.1 hypothetical protein MHC_00755 [Mycoplasma haemocanis str. Illinois]